MPNDKESPAEELNEAKRFYERLAADREPFLMRARECSVLTIPTLIPPLGHTSSTVFSTPFQGIGARGVNNLSAKLLLALLPPNTPCFRLQIDDFTLQELTKQEGMRAKVEEGLGEIERAVQFAIETGALRSSCFEGIKHLVVGGNALLYLPDAGGMRVFPLSNYVVQRDPMGTPLKIVVKECVAPDSLPADVKAFVEQDTDVAAKPDKTLELYTLIEREDGKWSVEQQINGLVVPGSEGTYPIDKCPWIPVRFIRVDGESYGRSYVEEYLGDLKSLEGLSQAIVEGSAAAAKVLFLVNPNGTTDPKTLAESENGAIADGNAADVTVLQVQKQADFRVALETMGKIEERMAQAFLLNSSIQRSGERVTAEEIRYMAGELEAALGGIYSILSQELQLPMINRIMFSMERRKKLPQLPKGAVTPVIVTGIEALGRGNDLTKLMQFFAAAAQIASLPPDIDKNDALTRLATSLGIDQKGLVRDPQAVAQEQQNAQQQAIMAQAAGPAVNQVGHIVRDQMAAAQGAPSGNQTPSAS